MMNPADLEELRSHVFRWVDQAYDETKERTGRATSSGFDPAVASEIAAQGWLSVMVSPERGGMGGGLAEMAAIMEAVGRGLVAEPVMSQGVIAAPLLDRLASPAASRLLADILEGRGTAVLMHNEADAGFERTLDSSRLEQNGGGLILSAAKAAVLDAPAASTLLVTARHGSGRMAVVAVDPKAEGVRIRQGRSVDGRVVGSAVFDHVAVPAEAVLSGEDDATALVERIIEDAALLVCAEACGALPVLVDQTADYLRTRRQFGVALASFQVLQHRMVDMLLAAEEASAIVEAALDAAAGAGRDRAFALAKVVTARSARHVAREAVQLHGGIGMTDDLKISRYFRRLMHCETLFGDADWHAERFDRLRP